MLRLAPPLILILCAASAGPAQGVPLPATDETALTWDLTAYEEAAPALHAARLALDDPAGAEEALAALDAALDEPPDLTWRDPHTLAVARWLRAGLLRELGEDERAAEDEEALLESGSNLADPVRIRRARSLAASGEPRAAARLLLEVTPGTADHLEACEEAARLLREAGALERGAAALEEQLARPLDSWTRAKLTLLTADLHVEAGDVDAAARLLRELWWHTSADSLAEEAAAKLDALERPLDGAARIARIVLKAPRWRADRAAGELRRWKGASGLERPMIAWGRAVLSRWDEGARERAIERLEELAPEFGGTNGEPWLRFGQAMVLRTLHRDVEAAERYERVAERWPDHLLAAQALVEAGGLMAHEGMPAEADALFRRALKLRRPGEADRQALWEVGFGAFLRGDQVDAIIHLTRLVERYGGDRDGLGVTYAERGGYWLARALEVRGNLADAVRYYTELAVRFPLGWYGILATARRQDLLSRPDTPRMAWVGHAGPELAVQGELPPMELGEPLEMLRVVRRPILDRAVALVRLGEIPAAADELRSLYAADRLPGSGRALLARVLRELGDTREAARVLRSGRVLAEVPSLGDDTYADAYTFGHRRTIERVAEDHGVTPGLLAGLVHVESRFQPRARSGAGAVGLTQVLPATARWVARRVLGRRISRGALRDPQTNLELGGAFLGQLMKHFQENPALALAAYNAGRGRARQWLRQRGHLETDAFVETIPFSQTRRYVMRVVASAEVYRRLHDLPGAPVEVPMALPLALGPFMD